MNDKHLSLEAYKRIRSSRIKTTIIMFLFIPAFAFFAYLIYNSNLSNNYLIYALPIVVIIAKLFIIPLFEAWFTNLNPVECPKCYKIIEKSKIIDHPYPKECPVCKLKISSNK